MLCRILFPLLALAQQRRSVVLYRSVTWRVLDLVFKQILTVGS